MAKKKKSPKFVEAIRHNKTVRNVVLGVTATIGAGALYSVFSGGESSQSLDEQQAQELRQMHKNEMHRVDSILNRKYKITDWASFQQLYKDALPLIQLSMFSTEVLVKGAYADADGRSINTRGLGSYYVPVNGDPFSSEWELCSKYMKKHPEELNKEISGDYALDLSDGWYSTREGGRILRTMFKKLQGCELTINEFAAIATCYYNNEKRGKEFCEFVSKNYQDSVKCASWLIPAEGVKGFGGIAKRATHEACMYLNINDYVSQIGDQRIAKIEGTNKYKTSVTQLPEDRCIEAGADLRKGHTKKLSELANNINRYVCKNGKSAAEMVRENIGDTDRRMALLMFTDQSIDMLKQIADRQYAAALEEYNNGNYEKALAGFQRVIKSGFDGADLHNDLAITYFHLGRYEDCLKECHYILHETGETSEFAHAAFNAGKAADALGQSERAYENYKVALKHDKKNQFYRKLVEMKQKDLGITNEPIESIIGEKKPAKAPAAKGKVAKPAKGAKDAKAITGKKADTQKQVKNKTSELRKKSGDNKKPQVTPKKVTSKKTTKPVNNAKKAAPQKKPAKRGGNNR